MIRNTTRSPSEKRGKKTLTKRKERSGKGKGTQISKKGDEGERGSWDDVSNRRRHRRPVGTLKYNGGFMAAVRRIYLFEIKMSAARSRLIYANKIMLCGGDIGPEHENNSTDGHRPPSYPRRSCGLFGRLTF
ncbi:hypothetical protein GWI33_013087 [Rhynchophorus ferrugineus]|uniref:Uncharacterized protein n=1 Tax=Rhynchophorus ferrugineus TaxID=354439 RepID=A0A834IA12_RHYFE|nr:hypothetical protein GWI33_013087 [Rhynchophorus ferrugineus]